MATYSVLTIVLTALISYTCAVPVVSNTSAANETFDPSVTMRMSQTTAIPAEVPYILVTLGLIGGCAMAGVGIAKFADLVYDKHIQRFSKKDVNENTRKLLRARVAIMRMKADPKAPELRAAKRAATKWMGKTAGAKPEPADLKDPGIVNEIGKPHVPGMKVELHEADHQFYDKKEDKNTAQNQPVGQSGNPVVIVSQDLHPVEKITVKIKPGGPLPPVSVNETNKIHPSDSPTSKTS